MAIESHEVAVRNFFTEQRQIRPRVVDAIEVLHVVLTDGQLGYRRSLEVPLLPTDQVADWMVRAYRCPNCGGSDAQCRCNG